jgi:methyl-accepting chemotaxis protein
MKLTPPPARNLELQLERTPLLLRDFRRRYFRVVIFSTFAALLIIGGSSYVIHLHNYSIFSEIALNHAPQLIENLERERIWSNIFLLGSTGGLIAAAWIMLHRLTNRVLIPIWLLQNHLRRLTRGDMSQRQIRIRAGDEFQELIDTYNYFYSSLQLQVKKDLTMLETLPVDEKNRDAQRSLLSMIDEKRAQIS